MTTYIDSKSLKSAVQMTVPTVPNRQRSFLLTAGLVAGLAVIGGIAASRNDSTSQNGGPTDAFVEVVNAPAVSTFESAIIRAERQWGGSAFDQALVATATIPSAFEAIVAQELKWGGAEMESAPAADLCQLHGPC
jgi:hypothetical protein